MVAGFTEGLTSGMNAGVNLGRAIVDGRNARGVQEANEVLSEMIQMDPITAGEAPYEEDTAIPTAGAPAPLPTGYSGDAWESAKQRYIAAMSKVTDTRTLAAMDKRVADLEKTKIMENGQAAITALQNGELDKAQRYFAAISFYTDPGVVPEIKVQPNGAVAVNSEGKTSIFTPDQAVELVHRLTDFNDWTQLAFNKRQHGDRMDHQAKVLAAETAQSAARLAETRRYNDFRIESMESEDERATARHEMDMARLRENRAIAEEENLRNRQLHNMGISEKQRDREETQRAAVFDAFEEMLADPEALGKASFPGEKDEDEMAVGDEAAIPTPAEYAADEANQQTAKYAASAEEERAVLAQRNAALRSMFANDPKMAVAAHTIMEAILSDPDMTDKDPRTIAALGFSAVLGMPIGEGGQPVAAFEPGRNELRVGNTLIKTDPAWGNSLAELLPVEAPPPNMQPGAGPQ